MRGYSRLRVGGRGVVSGMVDDVLHDVLKAIGLGRVGYVYEGDESTDEGLDGVGFGVVSSDAVGMGGDGLYVQHFNSDGEGEVEPLRGGKRQLKGLISDFSLPMFDIGEVEDLGMQNDLEVQ